MTKAVCTIRPSGIAGRGCFLKRQQSNNITLIDVLEGVHTFLEGHFDDFEIPEPFVTKELPLKLAQLRERWERYVLLNAEWAARGHRGFERNRRDD
ncbi:hypothetical protein BN1086_04929 [Citrobacter koseri]|uniref:Uncharacterized protein n=1 Tax=Citrobacter koseri TaxID=545 RepID=A0A078LMV2_CITKO|nr:hypothetical protein BN1086_04929 [Citrobacter koseri]